MAKDERSEHERYIPWMPLGLSVALVAALLTGMLVLLPFYGRTEYQVGVYDATGPVNAVHYHGQVFIPGGGKVRRPDTQMAAVGRTDEGYFIYEEGPTDLSGGGGGQPNPSRPARAMFLRTSTGLYMPLTPHDKK